ncbi:unnamed protein product [Nippostrongylus brasiliensis]|uniref:Carbohydrate sulfotransferase n=1 Tax=Nippostrongylus brasiliensis TaxID=27835 RepID=A0A0N4Y8I9_NIPBR|nr:unnamed protein product [Nippostrongylus brasiliensis]
MFSSRRTRHGLIVAVFVVAVVVFVGFFTIDDGEDKSLSTTQFIIVPNISNMVRPFRQYREEYVVAPHYHLASCQIEKVMTTLKDGIFCYLFAPDAFVAANRTISEEKWSTRFCSHKKHFRRNMSDVLQAIGNESVLFAVIRHPIDRFLSAYLDKCIMYCDFDHFLDKYVIIKYGSDKEGITAMADQFDALFQQVGVTQEERAVIKMEILKGSTFHSTHSLEEVQKLKERVFADKMLLRKLYEIYFYDFMVFNFSAPEI